jgi:hypothetical protein
MGGKLLRIIDLLPLLTHRDIWEELAIEVIEQAIRDYENSDSLEERKEIKHWFQNEKDEPGSFIMFSKIMNGNIYNIRDAVFEMMEKADAKSLKEILTSQL